MKKLNIVMYHYVRRIENSRYPNIKGLELNLFIEQLNFFKKNFQVISVEDLFAAIYDNHKLPKNAMLLTFDDAYSDHFHHVYPILKKMKMQGLFYVPAKPVLENQVLDVNKVHFILASVNNINKLVKDLEKTLPKYQDEYSLDDFQKYFRKYAIANRFDPKEVIFFKRMLQHALPEKLRNIITQEFFDRYVEIDEEAFCKELYMDTHQLEHIINDGMHIGCHGYDHYWWNKLDPTALDNELDRSIQFLKQLGVSEESLTACYPYGGYNENVVSALKKKKFKIAFTTVAEVADIKENHPLLLPRLDTNDFLNN